MGTSPPCPLSENRRGGDFGGVRFFGDENLNGQHDVLRMPRDAFPGAKVLAAEFRRAPSGPERAAWELLRGRRCLGLKFRRQEAVLSFILDFYCPALLLGVEIDGPTHRDDGIPERDLERDDLIRTQGIEVVRIPLERVTMPDLENAIRPFLDRRRWR
jgi:very-short-patch-repair endonuclease